MADGILFTEGIRTGVVLSARGGDERVRDLETTAKPGRERSARFGLTRSAAILTSFQPMDSPSPTGEGPDPPPEKALLPGDPV